VDVVAELAPIERFSVYLVRLDPAVGAEMRKVRPCVIISPEISHRFLQTVIVAPLTTTLREYPTRVSSKFGGKPGEIALDQIRALDRSRLGKRLGKLDNATAARVVSTLLKMFG
jgi:mRNA interferase MazF